MIDINIKTGAWNGVFIILPIRITLVYTLFN